MNVIDTQTGLIEKILDQSQNSKLVTQTKLTEAGINCSQWFTDFDFNKRFKEVK